MRRLAAGMTRADLAAAFDVAPSTVSEVLAGKARPKGAMPVRARPADRNDHRPYECPTRARWAGRLPAERPAAVPAPQWAAFVRYVGGASARAVAAELGIGESCARGRILWAARRLAALGLG